MKRHEILELFVVGGSFVDTINRSLLPSSRRKLSGRWQPLRDKILGDTITGQQIWKHASLVAEVRTQSADRIAILQLDAEQPVVLTGTAAAVWTLIDGYRTQAEIADELDKAYDDPEGYIRSQLASFLDGLASQRFISPAAVEG